MSWVQDLFRCGAGDEWEEVLMHTGGRRRLRALKQQLKNLNTSSAPAQTGTQGVRSCHSIHVAGGCTYASSTHEEWQESSGMCVLEQVVAGSDMDVSLFSVRFCVAWSFLGRPWMKALSGMRLLRQR